MKRIEPVSLSPGTEKVRMAKNQVSPKRNITPLMLTSKCIIVCLLIDSFLRAAIPLLCRTSTTIIHVNMIVLKVMIARIGARKAPQKAPA